jgi:aryl-alcohol dehydrogenase-like predicted oxidoreductase
VLDDRAVRDELDALRSDGVAVGVSVTGPEQGATIDRAVQTGAFDTVQATWNLLERSAGPALQSAHEAGMGVIVKEALANGRLGPRGAMEPITRVATRLGVGEDALAIAAVMTRPWVDTVLSGASTVTQLESNLSALEVSWDQTLEDELAAVVEAPDAYWKTRSGLRWT